MNEAFKRVIEHAIDQLEALKGQEVEASELHHHLFNEDYFIIGTARAKDFCELYGVFDAIKAVTQYETDSFGEVTTDIASPERVANMLAYILGEEVLSDCETLQDQMNNRLSDEDFDAIKSELEQQLEELQL